jgi:hypothetical protein
MLTGLLSKVARPVLVVLPSSYLTCFPARRPLTQSTTAQKSQVVIRRPAHVKIHRRKHSPSPNAQHSNAPGPSETTSIAQTSLPEDEANRLRELLRPPPIPGIADWGIPPPSSTPPDPSLQVCMLAPPSPSAELSHYTSLFRLNSLSSPPSNHHPRRNTSTTRSCPTARSGTRICTPS